MLGGESGDVVTPYDASSSLLWQEVSTGSMPPYGSGNEYLTLEQVNLIADWINDGALEEEMEEESDPDNWDCQYDSDCMDGEFCAIECFTGPCGLDESETSGTIGQYCQPCDECQYPEDAVSGNCDACETSDDGGDGGDGAPDCMTDCEGIETVDPDVDANAFCEWYMDAYQETDCLDDCSDGYDLMIEQIYFMCELCLPTGNCDEMWNSEDCYELDQSECELSEDCIWDDYSMSCEDCGCECLNSCGCAGDLDCEWNEDAYTCEDSTTDGPPECWVDCEGIDGMENVSGTEFCTWFISTYDEGGCLDDCSDCGPENNIYIQCETCMDMGSGACDDWFGEEDSCEELGQSDCESSEECSWNDYDMMCEDYSDDDGPPVCLEDCAGIENVNPEDDANAFCQWYIPVYDDGSCMNDCSSDYMNEFDAMYQVCQDCLATGDCTGVFDDSEDDCPSSEEEEACWVESCSWTSGLTDEWAETVPNPEEEGQLQGFCESLSDLAEGDLSCTDPCIVEGCEASDIMWFIMYCDSCVEEGSCNDIYNINTCDNMVYCTTEFSTDDCEYIVGDPICTEDEFYQLTGMCDISVCNDGGNLDNDLLIEDTYRISSVYPNPFNPSTTITYYVPKFSNISIDIYNMNGQIVYNLYTGLKNPGDYSITWNASNMSSGIYLIKLVSGSFVETQKVILIK